MIANFRPYPVSVSCNCLPTLTLDDPARAQHPVHPAMFSLHSLTWSGTNANCHRAETSLRRTVTGSLEREPGPFFFWGRGLDAKNVAAPPTNDVTCTG